MVEVRRLDLLDVDEIRSLFWECHTAEAERVSVRKGDDLQANLDSIPKYWDMWIGAIKKYYLTHVDEKHFLYGVFKDDRLMCFLGWRCDIPAPYDKDWIIVYLKSTPDINATMEYMPILWRFMFDKCEADGLTTYHSLIEPHRLNKYDSFYRRKIPDIDNRYTFETTMVIPADTKPEVEWVWAMMGRQTHKVDYILRTGTLKK